MKNSPPPRTKFHRNRRSFFNFYYSYIINLLFYYFSAFVGRVFAVLARFQKLFTYSEFPRQSFQPTSADVLVLPQHRVASSAIPAFVARVVNVKILIEISSRLSISSNFTNTFPKTNKNKLFSFPALLFLLLLAFFQFFVLPRDCIIE